jgi:uroporphyrinogen decarboxylase
VFEISEDLVGYEYLCLMLADDPELVGKLFVRIGDLMVAIWDEFLRRYGRGFAICRFGDDLGFKTSTLLAPATIRQHVVPQHKRVIDRVHQAGGTFLLHCCGNVFDIMEAEIAAGIDAKHSNEEAIAPFDKWIELYGGRIGLFGGIDVDLLVREKPDEIRRRVVELGSRFRAAAKGFALGSGNSIPAYVPADGYLAMIEGAKEIRAGEKAKS